MTTTPPTPLHGSVETVDAVVIGSGPNGLVAANHLADAGWDVLVLEANEEPGGAVRTAESTAPGFRNDVCSAFYPLGAGSPIMRDLGLEEHGLRWRHAPEVLAHVLPDDRAVLLSRDAEVTAASVERFAAGDGDAWLRQFAHWQGIRDALLEVILRPFPPVRGAVGLARALGGGPELLRFARHLTLSTRRYGEETFGGEGARVLLAGNAMHTDLGPDQAGSGVFGWLLAMLGQDVGFPVPEGGAGEITAALIERLKARGGTVRCANRVTSVLHARGRAMGVRTADGTLVRARRAVVADVPAPTLYLGLVGEEHLPSRLVADLAKFEWDDATIEVEWALSSPIPWTAPEPRRAGTVHLGADFDGLAGIANDLQCNRVPETPFLLLGQMTTADPSRSPAGTESVWAYTHVARGETWGPDRLRERAAVVEQTIERHAPGFRDLIMARAIRGPAEMEAMNPSLVEGSINSGTAAIHQQLVFRPIPGLGRSDTPIDRLFLASGSAHPGGGVHGAVGANAARAALARDRRPGYRTTISLAHRLVY